MAPKNHSTNKDIVYAKRMSWSHPSERNVARGTWSFATQTEELVIVYPNAGSGYDL